MGKRREWVEMKRVTAQQEIHLLMSTLTHLQSVPVSADAGHAEAVAARRGRRVSEHIEANGALELLVRQKTAI